MKTLMTMGDVKKKIENDHIVADIFKKLPPRDDNQAFPILDVLEKVGVPDAVMSIGMYPENEDALRDYVLWMAESLREYLPEVGVQALDTVILYTKGEAVPIDIEKFCDPSKKVYTIIVERFSKISDSLKGKIDTIEIWEIIKDDVKRASALGVVLSACRFPEGDVLDTVASASLLMLPTLGPKRMGEVRERLKAELTRVLSN